MLIALNPEGERVQGDDAIKGDRYFCQQCSQQVIAKKGRIKIHHFAHYPNSSPCVWWEPESAEHLLMKKRIMKLLRKGNNAHFARLEYKIEYHTSLLYPDVYLELKNGERIAVECQVSDKSLDDFITKTKQYTNLGIYTLWIYPHNEDYDIPTGFEAIFEPDDKELRIPAMRLQSHRWNYGRIYTMDALTIDEYDQNILEDTVNAVHFHRVERVPEYNPAAERRGATFQPYYPKTLRFTSSRILDSFRILCMENNGMKIARFYDKKWWR